MPFRDFYLRDAVSAVLATATCLAGWLAGWLSFTRRYCIKTAKPIWKSFRPSESIIILVSWDPCADTQFHRQPLHRGLYVHGVRKIGGFRWKWPISRKRCEIGRYGDYGTLIAMWFELTVTVTEMAVNWKVTNQLTVTVSEKCGNNCN